MSSKRPSPLVSVSPPLAQNVATSGKRTNSSVFEVLKLREVWINAVKETLRKSHRFFRLSTHDKSCSVLKNHVAPAAFRIIVEHIHVAEAKRFVFANEAECLV